MLNLSIASIIAASGVSLGLLIACALLFTRGQRAYPNHLLAVGVLISSSYLLSLVAQHSPDLAKIDILRLCALSIFLIGPTLYLYIRAMCEARFRLHWIHLLHLLPCVIVLLDYLGVLTYTWPGDGPVLIDRPRMVGVIFYLMLLAYLGVSALRLRRYDRALADEYSSLEGARLQWLNILVTLSLVLALLGLVFALGRWLFDVIAWPQGIWSMALMVSIYYLIAFIAITRPIVFNPPEPATHTGPRYETSSLSDDDMRSIYKRLEQLMASRQPYLDNQLKIAELAALLELPVNHLSQTINQITGCSFFEYVNKYRVEAAKRLLVDEESSIMLAVAMDAGFNSESVFYRQFKQHTGLTPKRFRRQHQSEGQLTKNYS